MSEFNLELVCMRAFMIGYYGLSVFSFLNCQLSASDSSVELMIFTQLRVPL